MAMKVQDLLNSVKQKLLEDEEGVRWSNDELVDYLNQGYRWLFTVVPEAFADNSEFSCVSGTRQTVAGRSTAVVEVVRNLEGAMRAVTEKSANAMDRQAPGWHGHPHSNQQIFFMVDDRDPRVFYVYPPATDGSVLEVRTIMEPRELHSLADYEGGATELLVPIQYTEAMRLYVLYRAFDKSSEDAENFQLSKSYLADAYNVLGVKMQNDIRLSPNNPASKR